MIKYEVDEVIKNIKESIKVWVEMFVYKRVNIFYKVVDLLLENIDEIVNILVFEIVKDIKFVRVEVERIVDFLRYIVDVGKNMEGEVISGDNFFGGIRNKMFYVLRVLLGIVLVIFFFNYFVNLLMLKIVLVFIGGNVVVLKFVI